jgi:hypothetical protein
MVCLKINKYMLLTFILSSFFIFIIGKSLEPDGEKAFDADAYELFADMYKKYDTSPPPREDLKQYSGVELDLYYLVSFLLENDREKLEKGDFVDQVMNQYEGCPEDMMKYVEGYISGVDDDDDDDDDDEVLEEIEPPPAGSPPLQIEPPLLQIVGGSPTPALIENVLDMDTTRDEAKRKHHMTRQHSKTQVLEENN